MDLSPRGFTKFRPLLTVGADPHYACVSAPPRPFPRSMRQNPAYFPLPPFLAGHTWSPIPNSAISFLPGPCATSSAGFLPKVTPQAASASHQDGSPNDSFTWLVSTPLLSPQRFLVRGPTGVGP